MLQSLLDDANLKRLHKLVISLPGQTSLCDLTAQITGSVDKSIRYEAVLTAGLHLSNPDGLIWDDDQAFAFAQAIVDGFLSFDSGSERDPAEVELGIACLHILSSTCSYKLDDSTLLKLVAFTDARDPWTTNKAAKVALNLLQIQLEAKALRDFVVGPVLQDFLKPLFAKSSTRVTESGRPAYYHHLSTDPSQQSHKTLYWNQKSPWAISALGWAVDVSEPSLIKEQWPLFTPVLLTIAEDESLGVKARGLEMLALFVKKCTPQVLHSTGIGLVIEDVTFPALLYLPSLTPEEDSIRLLDPAYRVLIGLAEMYGPTENADRRRLLDKVLREGILEAHFHASQYAHLIEILMKNTASCVTCLGIYSTKHLKNILSVISSILEDPFATAYPPALLEAIRALRVAITNCWPRLQERAHFEHIVRALSLCWLNLHGGEEDGKMDPTNESVISQELLEISKILGALRSQADTQPPGDLSQALEKEPRLANLFQTWSI